MDALLGEFDVAVVGAGLAGGCAAILLAQSGARVVLLDAGTPGAQKVCGEFLSPESRAQLTRLGIWDAMQAAGALPVSDARILTTKRRGHAISLSDEGVALSRAALDAILWARAGEVGVQTHAHTPVQSIERASDGAFLVHTRGGDFRARFVLSATGRTSKLGRTGDGAPEPKQRFVGLKTHLLGARVGRGEVAVYPFKGGYCGLVGVEDGRVNACLLAPYARLKGRSPAALWEEVCRENCALSEATHGATPAFEWIATGNVSFERFAPIRDGVLRVGDAAGYIHPLSGDGMAMALRSGELAARTVQHALRYTQSPLAAADTYALLWNREFARRLRWARTLQPFFSRPMWANTMIFWANLFPTLTRLTTAKLRGRPPVRYRSE